MPLEPLSEFVEVQMLGEEGFPVSSPALYWTYRFAELAQTDILASGHNLLQTNGMTSIVTSAVDVSGRTPTVHAVIAPVKIKDPPGPGPGLGTTAPPTFVIFFCAAGDGAKDVRDKLGQSWDKLKFL